MRPDETVLHERECAMIKLEQDKESLSALHTLFINGMVTVEEHTVIITRLRESVAQSKYVLAI